MTAHLARALRLCGLAVCVFALLAPEAIAGVATKRDGRGEVRANGLSGSQRQALDITSVRVFGAPTFGLTVTVTFAGNFERAVGRGRLTGAQAALTLDPRSGGGRRATLVTSGRGHYGRTRRTTRSRNVLVMRRARQVTFQILGPGVENVRAVRVVTSVSASDRGRRSRSQASQGRRVADRVAVPLPPEFRKRFDECGQLQGYISLLESLLENQEVELDRAEDDGETKRADELEKAIARNRSELKKARDQFEGCKRTCVFSFSQTGQRTYLVTWRCDQAHREVVFDYSVGVSRIFTDVGNAPPPICNLVMGNPNQIRCVGEFQPGTTYIYAIELISTAPASCDPGAIYFDPTVDGILQPRVPCSG